MSTTKVQGDMIDVDGATVAVVAAGDKFNFLDITDSLVKEDTVQGILDLGGGFTLGTEQATTSGTSYTFGSIPAGTTQIVIMLEAVSFTAGVELILTLGDAGGLETTGYVGKHSLNGSTNSDLTTSSFQFDTNQNAADQLEGTIWLSLKDAANFTWICTGIMMTREGSSNLAITTGSKSLSAELTQVSLSGGTGDVGSVNIMYQ